MNRLFAILLLTTLPMLAMAQRPHPILKEFSGFRQDKGIMLKWVIAGGNQCNGIDIYRAMEQGGFLRVGNIAGICGSAEFDETYTFLDTTAIRNRDNSYRLELGWQGYTEVITVFFSDLNLGRHTRLTDHSDGSVRFIFDNPQQLPVTVELYDVAGVPVMREMTDGGEFLLRPEGLRSGVYIYRIGTDGAQPVVGRMTIGR